jgi:prophage regulatory protein
MYSDKKRPRFLRIGSVCEQIGLSPSFVYKLVRTGEFPAPRKVGGKSSVWVESEVLQWMEKTARGGKEHVD